MRNSNCHENFSEDEYLIPEFQLGDQYIWKMGNSLTDCKVTSKRSKKVSIDYTQMSSLDLQIFIDAQNTCRITKLI